jgi:predicted lipoprotein
MQKLLAIVAATIVAAVLFWFLPLFHIVRIGEASTASQNAQISAAALADKLWQDKLPAALDRAADLSAVSETIRNNPKQVRERFGRSAGLGRSYLLLVRGSGTIESVDRNKVAVALEHAAEKSNVVLLTGPLFGNTVRDAPGLANASEFANSQQFNDLSTELNRLVENRVIAPFNNDAKAGSHIHFIACAEILNESADFQSLKLIPLNVKFE